MKKPQRSSFKLNPIAAAIAMAMASQFSANVALAGSGWGYGNYVTNPALTVPVQTFYANSPAGRVTALDPVTGLPTIDPVSNLPITVDTGKALRKFVDTLPGIPGITSFGANNLGQYIPIAVPEKWTDALGNKTDDYYEIAAVEFAEQMHSDLVDTDPVTGKTTPHKTRMRGYVQLETAGNAAASKHIALAYPDGSPILDAKGVQVYAYDNPHHLGPIVQAASGTAVRVKFTNYLPVGGNLFLPVDKSITGAGLGPDGKTYYTENRAEIHLVGGQAPWVSAGTPHQWVAPAGETAAYTAGLGKGVSTQNVPDMGDPGAGSTTLYFPNTQSARFMFYQDRTSGLTRLNSYAGLEAGYLVTDPTEAGLVAGGVIPADLIPLIIEDKTFVPANISQQDAKWDTAHWGKPGDLWFPHVYETNQDPKSINATNPVGRWDYGPWFWPIFAATAPLPSGNYGDASFVPESYEDTPVINGTAYPTLTVDPKAYRFRILNASNDRYINLGLYKADTTVQAPQLDRNGNPIFDASGNQLFFTNTEVKMVPAVADVTGAPLTPTYPVDPLLAARGYDCLCQYPNLPQLQPAIQFSGPNRAWPIDGRVGGTPDPTAVGPDFIAIGTDGGLLPNPVDIPSQPVTYEANRRSITVTNIYGYGLLLGPSERTDAIVDFSAYAGQTLILYNDAPAPTPFNDQRDDYYTGDPDQTGIGGTYSTKPGYGPNTRTMMQIKVNAAPVAATGTFNASTLLTALPAAYKASQAAPIVPESAYNAAFGTSDADNYAHVATGSVAQPNLDFTPTPASGSVDITGVNLISSGGQLVVGTTNIVGNAIPGSGTGYLSAPIVNFNFPIGGTCTTYPVATAIADTAAVAAAAVPPHQPSYQVTSVAMTTNGSACTAVPLITFTSTNGGEGAQGTVVASQAGTPLSQSILVQTKSEQELFDAAGRYNSTGGVELPLTSGTTQTTVPLNYTDSPTEIIGDSEVQIWKLVDNGFWSNSMHFDFVDVQLINRVGWDGTVKAPASNEVGWKDTLRLNPLEDVIVAMRAKRASVPFGQPASKRYQDPSLPAGATNRITQLPFLADPGVTSPAGVALLTTTTNVTAQYDNEFVWNSAILGHSEDDFMRPIAYHPTVTVPAAPSITGGSGGTLNWTDATPAGAAATLGNPASEIGFKVLRATYGQNGLGNNPQYNVVGTVPANATSFKDTTQVAGTDYSYEVVAWNAAGSATSTAYTQITAPAVPTWAVTSPVVINSNGSVTLKWNTVTGATGYVVTANGSALPAIGASGNSTQSATVTLPLGINYTSITVTAQQVKYGLTAISAASSAVTANLSAPVAPAAPTGLGVSSYTAGGTTARLTWTDSTSTGVTGYVVQQSLDNGTTWTQVGNILGATATTANVTVANGNSYLYQVLAQSYLYAATNYTNSAASNQASLLTTPVAPGVVSNVAASVASATSVNVSWTASATTGASYIIQRKISGGNWTTITPTITPNGTTLSITDTGLTTGNTYTYQVAAQSTNSAGTTTSAYVASSNVSLTAPATPTAPSSATATASGTSVALSWVDAGATVTGYVIQRNAGNTGYVTLTTLLTNTTSYTDNSLVAGTTYAYRVAAQATNVVGSTNSNYVTATNSAAPTAPTIKATTVVGTGGQLTVNWTDNSSNESGFTIQRRTGGTGTNPGTYGGWTTIATPTATVNAISYGDTVPVSTWVQYQVLANGFLGNSGYNGPSTGVRAK